MYLRGYFRPNQAQERGVYGRRQQLGAFGAYFRPNQARDRGVYGSRTTLAGLGAAPIAVDPTLLLWGVGALALGFFLFGTKAGPDLKKRKIARLASRREALTRQLRELEQ
jgi:hypothetical protein